MSGHILITLRFKLYSDKAKLYTPITRLCDEKLLYYYKVLPCDDKERDILRILIGAEYDEMKGAIYNSFKNLLFRLCKKMGVMYDIEYFQGITISSGGRFKYV